MLLENKIAVISKAAAMGRPETRGPENIRYWCVSLTYQPSGKQGS
jgi:hypothetical protein